MQKANTFSFTHKNYENGLECDVMFMSLPSTMWSKAAVDNLAF